MGLGYETEHPFDDDDDDYLRQHPDHEKALWRDWVVSVCKQRLMIPPDGVEWVTLMQHWHHGKAPLESADELALMRKTPNAEVTGGPLAARPVD